MHQSHITRCWQYFSINMRAAIATQFACGRQIGLLARLPPGLPASQLPRCPRAWPKQTGPVGAGAGRLCCVVRIKMPKSGKQSQSSDALTSASASCVDAALMARHEKPKTSKKKQSKAEGANKNEQEREGGSNGC